MNNTDIVARLNQLRSSRANLQDAWDMIERYIAPYRGRFFRDDTDENAVDWRRSYVYDGTAIAASQSLAAHLHSSLTSPKIKWFELRFRSPELNENREAAAWLDDVSDRMYKALQDSNFTVQSGETYQDLVDYGTSIIVEEAESEDEWRGINFASVPIKEAFFDQNYKGGIENFYRCQELTALQLRDRFGERVPEHIAADAADPVRCTVKHKVVFCIYRRQSIDATDLDLRRPIPATSRPFGYKWVLEASAETLGEEGGYYEMPAFVPRWRKTSGSMWGNSPAMVALSDTITLNKLIEMHIAAMEKVIDPSTLVTERGLLGDLDLAPGGITVVRSVSDIKVMESAARFDVSYQEISRYRDQIREYFMIDQLMLPPMEGTPATATEIAARVSQLERLIGPTLGRLQADFLDPCVVRTFNIMMRAGQFPPPPDIVAQAGASLDIEYVGFLARTQQQDQVNSIERWLMQIGQVAQAAPQVLDIPDWDRLMKGTAAAMGVPAKYLRSDADIKQTREEREEMQRAMQEAEIAAEQGKAAEREAKATGGAPV